MSSFTWPLSRKMLANLTQQERHLLADKLMDLANLGYGGLVLGQILNEEFKVRAAVLGMSLFVVSYLVSISILKGGR